MGSLHNDDFNNKILPRILDELCENGFQERIPSWGPAKKSGDKGFIRSWTDTISKSIGPDRHYITCTGESNGTLCSKRWNRQERSSLDPGIYCIFNGHVEFDGTTISEVQSSSTPNEGRSLSRLRQIWANHVQHLSSIGADNSCQDSASSPGGPLLSQEDIEKMRVFLKKAVSKSVEATKSQNGQKILGQGAGGRTGVTETGLVLKRDTGLSIIGNYEDHCDREPGGYFRKGEVEVWVTWHGWSSLTVRDGRWRPGFHLEILLFLLTTIVDYSASRELWRVRDLPWAMAAEWAWTATPPDVHHLFTEGIVKDLREMYRREAERLQKLAPSTYQADDGRDREAQYYLLLDRAGESISRHVLGESLSSPRGYISAWALCAANDILDYERDVLAGETNNLVRGLTSKQQVVDAAYLILLIVDRACAHRDYEMVTDIIGSLAFYLLYWRYNSSKQYRRYQAVGVGNRKFENPPELAGLVDLLYHHYPVENSSMDAYRYLYARADSTVKEWYGGCTCVSKPPGHDTWKLLAQALDEGNNEVLEERMTIEFSNLGIGASHGDIRCECGLDLIIYEAFIRFLHPDTGFVCRLHYRTHLPDGNILVE